MTMRMTLSVMMSLMLLGLTACKQQSGANDKGEVAGSAKPVASAGLPADLFVDTVPEGARSVAEVKADEGAAGEVVIVGRVGGRGEPFVPGAAMFLLVDSKLKSCDQMGDEDHCPEPWDYCCVPADSLLANTATVQIVGEDGKPLAVDLQENSPLAPLRTVTITGEIAKRDESGTLVINAKRIHVGEKPMSES